MGNPVWNKDWFRLPGEAVFSRERQKITALARSPQNLDLFAVGNDSFIWTTYWNAGGWSPDWYRVPGQAIFNRDTQLVTAVSRAPDCFDLFIVGNDGRVWSTYWNPGGWNHDWFPLPGAARFNQLHQHVAAVSRAAGNLDLFIVGNDGHVWSTYWNSAAGWAADWFPLAGAATFDLAAQEVVAVTRGKDNLDLFIIGNDDRVWSRYWNPQEGWNPDFFPLPGAARFDHLRQKLAAVSRAHGNLDLFVIGNDDHVWTTFWNGQWSPDWFRTPGAAVFDHLSQRVTAVSRAAGNLDLFVVGNDGRVWSSYWNDQAGWCPDWFPLPGVTVFDRATQHVAAVRRTPNNLDLFIVGNDSHAWSTAWGEITFEFQSQIRSGGLAALGGWMKLSLSNDGSARWQGHAHNAGIDGYDFAVSAVARAASGKAVAVAHKGHVGGTLAAGSKNHDWDMTEPNALVRDFHFDFSNARFETHVEYESDIGGVLEKALSWLVKFSVGSALGPVGAVVFVGVEAGSLIMTGSLVPGARVLEGVLWMAGPANTLFAIAAHGIASQGSKSRQLSVEEYDWANNEVFKGCLPARDRILLTDTIGGENRAFTFPRFDGKITLNMGEESYANPRHHKGVTDGRTFIHELVHACQIEHAKMDLVLIADAMASKVCEASGETPYQYGAAGMDYRSLNLEQQAQIVEDWFVGQSRFPGTNHTNVAKDDNSPYFTYITNNLRVGLF